MSWITAADVLRASPWLAIPLLAVWRTRGARTLAQYAPAANPDAPRVSVIVPARNEARNIGRCVQSILAAPYPRLQLIVVDDHSHDRTAQLARDAGGGDPRLTILDNPTLPPGWFGKQWACATGATCASGELLLFADADTAHAPDLVPRLVAAQRDMRADLISVAGRQELGSFWERLVQPQIFSILLLRYGGTEGVNRASRAADVIANGQCLMMTSDAYDAVGGHAAVKNRVAEDLMMAQATFRAGRRVRLVMGIEQLSTRMYTSLRELVEGWGKNVYAGGVDAMPLGAFGRSIFPILLLSAPLMMLAPPTMVLLAATGIVGTDSLASSLLATIALVVYWCGVYRAVDEPPGYGLLFPVGALAILYIFTGAIVRGRRVAWKGRRYVTAR